MILPALALAVAGPALDVPVCAAPGERLDPLTEAEFRTQLPATLPVPVRVLPCQKAAEAAVRIIIFERPLAAEPTALGAARIERRRVTGDVKLFQQPIANLIGSRLPLLLARAMARVAAHELRHWREQDHGHLGQHGWQAASVGTAHLLAPANYRHGR
ncbi:MAG: hypothetical protein FJW31_09820 [Acidobacteria bacterium]|nr:hypothetical protein [Acidobacteriota bacterium]